MKRLIHALLIFLVLGGFAWALWHGWSHRPKDAEDDAKAKEPSAAVPAGGEKEEPAEGSVTLDPAKAKALHVEVREVTATELPPSVSAWGRVLDPTPLVTLDGDLQAVEAALSASRAEFERSRKLLLGGENTSHKAAETAEAQFRTDEAKWLGLRRNAILQWGAGVAGLEATARREFIDGLVNGRAALVRVDVLPGDLVSEVPKAAQVTIAGRENEVIASNDLTPAADVDAKTQGRGFLIRIGATPSPLPAGLAVTARLELPGQPRAGFAIPRSALLRHHGATWVYTQEGANQYQRTLVQPETPLKDGDRWFVPAEGSALKAGDKLVVQGASSLLGAELQAPAKD